MKYILFLIVLLPGFSKPKPADPENNVLDRIVLSWDSFVKVENVNMPYIAYTANKTIYKYRSTLAGGNLKLKFEVSVLLDSTKTIVERAKFERLGSTGKSALLDHEQGHSDLAVLYGRKLYKKFVDGVYAKDDYKEKIKSIYDGVMKELADANTKYDAETGHGNNAALQQQWDEFFLKNL